MVCRATGIERSETIGMTRIVVTGGSGKAGRAVVHDLVENGYDVVNVDVVPASPAEAPFLRADLTRYGEAVEALRGADAVVHLAAIPAPRIRTVEQTFEINILSTYNVFSAAALVGLERVVWASSETVLGLPFGRLHARNLLDPSAEPGASARARLRPDRRGSSASTAFELFTLEGRGRGDGPPVRSLDRDPVHRPALLGHPRARLSTWGFPPPGETRIAASGTSGATSMPATSPNHAASP